MANLVFYPKDTQYLYVKLLQTLKKKESVEKNINSKKQMRQKQEMLNYNKLNPFKKLFYGIGARADRVTSKIRFMKMRGLNSLVDQYAATYNKNLSYRMKWFDFHHQKCLAQWDSVTDQIFGGQSTADLYFDKENQCGFFKGFVETKDKDRMVFYPFINLMRTHDAYVKLGPMRLFQVQAKTDGLPLQVNFTLKSLLKGQVNIYGFILSKSTDWHTYEIPIQNLILRGTQEDYHQGLNMAGRTGNYFTKRNETSIFTKDDDSVKRIIQTQIFDEDSVQISNVGFRLVSTQNKERHIRIRNINFAYKKGYENFAKEYMNPYFYKTIDEVDDQNVDPKAKKYRIQFLKNTLENVDTIDTGDIFYERKTKKVNKNA